jgi:hypothetical protein
MGSGGCGRRFQSASRDVTGVNSRHPPALARHRLSKYELEVPARIVPRIVHVLDLADQREILVVEMPEKIIPAHLLHVRLTGIRKMDHQNVRPAATRRAGRGGTPSPLLDPLSNLIVIRHAKSLSALPHSRRDGDSGTCGRCGAEDRACHALRSRSAGSGASRPGLRRRPRAAGRR